MLAAERRVSGWPAIPGAKLIDVFLPASAAGIIELLSPVPPGWGGTLLVGLLHSIEIAIGATCLGLLIGTGGAWGKLYGGPVNSKGEKLSPGHIMPGSELDWRGFIGNDSRPAGVHVFMAEMKSSRTFSGSCAWSFAAGIGECAWAWNQLGLPPIGQIQRLCRFVRMPW